MNWEAFLVIGVFAVISGLVLLVPGLIWARKKARQQPNAPASMSVTKIGYIYIGITLLVLFTGLTSQYWAPESSLGQWMTTKFGRFLFGGLVVVAALLVEKVLVRAGIELKVLVRK